MNQLPSVTINAPERWPYADSREIGNGMNTTTVMHHPLSFAGIPASAWVFGLRIWLAVVVALAASFWLELEAPSSAALTVAILAAPTRGQALEKAFWRMVATIIGVTAAIAITGFFSQTRDLLLAAFAAWVGFCIYAAGLLDGNRAYAAVLSGYTVALIAIQQMDTPQHVFEAGMERGAAIAVGIAAIGLVNDLLAAPDRHPLLASQLAALHRRVRDYATAVSAKAATDPATAAGLLQDIAALRPDLTSLATESASGSNRSAAARATAVALVAELHAARALNAQPATAEPGVREALAWALKWGTGGSSPLSAIPGATDPIAAPSAWACREVLRHDQEVREALAALESGTRPKQAWRTPFYRPHGIAAAAGIRAATWVAVASAFFVLAGWPAADFSLSLVAVVIGLGATTPRPRGFTVIALIALPIAAVLAGILEFPILDGATEFPLLAIALGPFMIGSAVLVTRPNRLLATLGQLNLVFILAILSPSNPPSYDPQSYLFRSLFVCVATGLLLAAQFLVSPVSNERRLRSLMAWAHRDLARVVSRSDRRLAPEEAMFRNAVWIGQVAGAAGTSPSSRAVLAEALSYFDQAAAIRLCHASLARLVGGPLSALAIEAHTALVERNTSRLRAVARALWDSAPAADAPARAASGALVLAGIAFDAAAHASTPITESGI